MSLSRWTCGECGEIFEADGVVGDLRVMRWRKEHKEEHRFDRMTGEEKIKHLEIRAKALSARFEEWRT